jgi:geranylgeranyl diphosphate synthase type II
MPAELSAGGRLHTPGELRDAFEAYLFELELARDLGELETALRYALESGGKRVRPVLCLAVAEAAGGAVEDTLPAACALELVHTFSLVHDDLPALDDDAERRGRPSAHVAFGEGVALLAGDALLAEAFRLVLSYERPEPARELAEATLGMIGGQHRDITGDDADLAELHLLKTGRLFGASVGLGLWAAGVPEPEQAPWRAFGDEVGLLFQVVDDILDEDGFAARLGVEGASLLADELAERARERLSAIPADTGVLRELVDALAVRTG